MINSQKDRNGLHFPRAVLLVGCLLIGLSRTVAVPAFQLTTVSELDIRAMAVHSVLPRYPKDAVKMKLQGVSVAELECNSSGKVVRVDVLQAPHPTIADAVKLAVAQWRFKRETGSTTNLVSKLTFYFVFENGKAKVRNPRSVEKQKGQATEGKSSN